MNQESCVRLAESGRVGERLTSIAIWFMASSVACVLLCIIGDLVWHGVAGLSLDFIIAAPARSGREGGVGPILVSTFVVLTIAIAVSMPIGLATAIGLSEFTSRESRFATFVGHGLDLLAAVPSIVFGLFGNALFCNLLGLGYSILAGGLTLACMVLPILARTIEASLRNVPDDYRVASASLGICRARCTASILLPAASSGIVVGLVLGIGRVLAETAALLFTSGYVDRMPRTAMDSGRVLSVHIYDLAMNIPGGTENAYTASLLLVGLLVGINLTASILVRYLFPTQRVV